jgi:hypothetical protein
MPGHIPQYASGFEPETRKEICGYFTQCDEYAKNLTCKHDDIAPVYEGDE